MTEFEIRPLVGLHPLRLGMTKDAATAILGEPDHHTVRDDCLSVYYPNSLNCAFLDNALFEIGATRRCRTIRYKGIDIFQTDPFLVLKMLFEDAGEAYESYGFIIFPRLGVTLTGFHDDDLDDMAMTMFVEGAWDDLRPMQKPISF